MNLIREDVKKALEIARTAKLIGGALEAKVVLHGKGETLSFLKTVEKELPTIFIVSQVEVTEEAGGTFTGEVTDLSVSIATADGQKCSRCWMYSETVGTDEKHPCLCMRCAKMME